MELDGVKNYFAVLGAFATIWWAIQQRRSYPRAEVTHRVIHFAINSQKTLLRVEISIRNKGKVLLALAEGFVTVHQIKPWPLPLLEAIEKGEDPVEVGESEFAWPLLDSRWADKVNNMEVEPGESDEMQFDFVLNSDIEVIKVYSHLQNIKRTFYQRAEQWLATRLRAFCRRLSRPMLRRFRRKRRRLATEECRCGPDGILAKQLRRLVCRAEKSFRRRICESKGIGWNTSTTHNFRALSAQGDAKVVLSQVENGDQYEQRKT